MPEEWHLRVTSDLHMCLHTQMHVYTHTHSHTHTLKTSHKNPMLSPDHCHLPCVLSRMHTCVQLHQCQYHLDAHSPTHTKSVVLYVRAHAQPPLPLTLHGPGLMLLLPQPTSSPGGLVVPDPVNSLDFKACHLGPVI